MNSSKQDKQRNKQHGRQGTSQSKDVRSKSQADKQASGKSQSSRRESNSEPIIKRENHQLGAKQLWCHLVIILCAVKGA